MFIDVHCHLDLLKNIEKVIKNAKEKKVERILTAGTNYTTNRKTLDIAKKYDIVSVALGVYPIDALKMSDKGLEEEIEFIKQNKEKITAIGEVGMDFKENQEKEIQKNNFLKFIDLAKQLGKPLIVHSRKAEEECVDLLEKTMSKKVLMHCFCGSKFLIKKVVENGWFLSVPTNVVFSSQFQELVKEVPLANLFCETDSPFLHPSKGERDNEPANVIRSYEMISKIKNKLLKEIEKTIANNFEKLFNNS